MVRTFYFDFPRSCDAVYILKDEYRESVNYHHQEISLWAEFDLVITNNVDLETVSIAIIAESEVEIDSVEYGLLIGVKDFFYGYLNSRINFDPFQIQITVRSFHPVDSRPAAFRNPVIITLKTLIETGVFELIAANEES